MEKPTTWWVSWIFTDVSCPFDIISALEITVYDMEGYSTKRNQCIYYSDDNKTNLFSNSLSVVLHKTALWYFNSFSFK